jgi:molybdate transport system substrate-binding protein
MSSSPSAGFLESRTVAGWSPDRPTSRASTSTGSLESCTLTSARRAPTFPSPFGLRAWPALEIASWLAVVAFALPWLAGCDGQSEKPRLLVYCGAGIRPPVAEIADVFSQRHGVLVECDYAGSEVLLSRIKLSRIGDLYIPGDVHYVEQAKQNNLATKSEAACYFIPVILVAKGNPKNIQSLADLTRPGVKLGLGDHEACAIGRKAKKIFAKNGISEEAVEANTVFRSMTVNELGTNVELGSLDATIVWDAVAAYFADTTEVVPIPPDQNVISTVAAAVLNSSKHPQLSQSLLDFIISDEGRAIFQKHHYSLSLPE